MYVRFIVPAHGGRDVDRGLFCDVKSWTRDSRIHAALREAIRAEYEWFNTNLPVPKERAFLVKSRGMWLADGICWFLDDAREMIARAFALAPCSASAAHQSPGSRPATRGRSSTATIIKSSRVRRTAAPAAGGPAFSMPDMEADMTTHHDFDNLPCFRGDVQTP